MTCKCGKFAHDPNCNRPEHSVSAVELEDARTVPSPAFYEERIRLLLDEIADLREQLAMRDSGEIEG